MSRPAGRTSLGKADMSGARTNETAAGLGFANEISRLQEVISSWIRRSSDELRNLLEWQFHARSKYFRPLTVFACYRAMSQEPVPESIILSAVVVEMFHNVSLIVDDILDRSEQRRGKPTLHFHFGSLPALMTAGYIVADGYDVIAHDPFEIRIFSELMKRLGVAECMQWRLRRQPLGVEDWLKIASEDTGSMFEACACLGTRSEELRQFGHFLGMLYHGCDDVGDAKSLVALGGGGDEDLRDGILTLPAALAIRDPRIGELFCQDAPSVEDLAEISRSITNRLADAEDYLDTIAEEAREQARLCANNAAPLLFLIDQVRELSRH